MELYFKHEILGIAVDSEDNIFVANWNKLIEKVSFKNRKLSKTQSTFILHSPLGLAINSKNEIYIGTNNAEIMKMTKDGAISSIAGSSGFADGIGKYAKIGMVKGFCFDENDIAFFYDYYYSDSIGHSDTIRKLTPEGKVTTICGGTRGFSDGKGKDAKFYDSRGIVYNKASRIFYITDYNNKSVRTMTGDGNVKTLCTYKDNLSAIAIDGEGKLYVSTVRDSSSREGELITIDPQGEIKSMNISVKWCQGMAFNSKGDLFITSDRNRLSVIKSCTKYPPLPNFSPLKNMNTNGNLCTF